MNKKEENITLDGFHAKELKFIELSLQDTVSTEQAIKFNKQHNYEYKFIVNNLINTKSLLLLIRNNYTLGKFASDIFKDDAIIIYHDDNKEK